VARQVLYQSSPNNVKQWSSGPIAVGSFTELIVDIAYKTISGGDSRDNSVTQNLVMQFSRITPFGRRIVIYMSQLPYVYVNGVPTLNGGQGGEALDAIDLDSGLGNSVQLDFLYNTNNVNVSFDISVVAN
jgi:hypothetical protein